MSSLIALRDAAICGIKAGVPRLATVEKVRGKITEQGLQRLSVKAPAVFVGNLGIRSVVPLDTALHRASVMMIGFLLTEGKDRIDQGTTLMEQITLCVLENTWGLRHTKLPVEFETSILYDDRVRTDAEKKNDFAENGMFLQGFAWVQETRIARVSPATGQGRADDRAQAEALGQKTEPGDWPHEIETVIDHPQGFK